MRRKLGYAKPFAGKDTKAFHASSRFESTQLFMVEKLDPEGQADKWNIEPNGFSKIGSQQRGECVTPTPVDVQCPARMSGKLAGFDDLRDRHFRDLITLPIDQKNLLCKHIDHFFRSDDIAEP